MECETLASIFIFLLDVLDGHFCFTLDGDHLVAKLHNWSSHPETHLNIGVEGFLSWFQHLSENLKVDISFKFLKIENYLI